MRTLLVSSLVVFSLAGAGCNSARRPGPAPGDDAGAGDDDGGTIGALTIMPADPMLSVDGKGSVSQKFKVFRGGQDVTAESNLYLDDGKLGSFSAHTFMSTPGAAGKTVLHAKVGSDEGHTTLTLRVSAVVIAPGAPADAPNKFGGADDPSLAPSIAYPPPGALVPPNLNELEVQWKPKAAQLFEVAFLGDGVDLKIYTKCVPAESGCALLPDEPTWKLLSGGGRGQSLQMTVRGTLLQGGGVGTSAPQTLSFADDDILGGLYYWAASSGGIYRYDFGRRGQKAESFYDPARAGGAQCVGCHALSRNGKRIAVGLNIPAPAQMRALDVATRKTIFEVGSGMMGFPGMGGSDYEAFTSDGERLVTTEGGGLTLRNGTTGALIGGSPAVANANMPDFSPDGSKVVFARGSGGCMFGICMTLAVMEAGLFTTSFTGNGFGGAKQIVAGGAGKNNYYPSFSPDGQFIVFNRSTGTSMDAPDARVMIVPAGGGTPVDLALVNASASSWPKWGTAPHRFKGSTIFWLTFSSRRAIGLRHPMLMGAPTSQLWMVPVDAAKLGQGIDPNFPPIRLPFQDINTGNHIAQWVEKIERAPCSQVDQTGCGKDEYCDNGVCVPKPG
ncbi:MAG: hypothetical protein EXR72_22000 [Myxococcales bacterium]|nr:hypothetical protein [Myxococcales bacterium]